MIEATERISDHNRGKTSGGGCSSGNGVGNMHGGRNAVGGSMSSRNSSNVVGSMSCKGRVIVMAGGGGENRVPAAAEDNAVAMNLSKSATKVSSLSSPPTTTVSATPLSSLQLSSAPCDVTQSLGQSRFPSLTPLLTSSPSLSSKTESGSSECKPKKKTCTSERMFVDNNFDDNDDDIEHFHACEDDDDDSRAHCQHSPRVGAGADSGDDDPRGCSIRERLSPPAPGSREVDLEGRVLSPDAPKPQPTPFSVVDILNPSKFTGNNGSRTRVWHPWGDRPSPGPMRTGDSDSGMIEASVRRVCVLCEVCQSVLYYSM